MLQAWQQAWAWRRPSRASARPLRCPALLAQQWHEADRRKHFGAELLLRHAGCSQQLLEAAAASDRHDQPCADRKLCLQCRRQLWAGGRHDDRVEGCAGGPAQCSVAGQHLHVGIAQRGEPGRGRSGKPGAALDRADLQGDARQHRRGIARAGADLEHRPATTRPQRFDHQCNDVGFGDRLALADRQRCVIERVLAQCLRHEELARHHAHGREDARTAHPARRDLLRDHVLAPPCHVVRLHTPPPRRSPQAQLRSCLKPDAP